MSNTILKNKCRAGTRGFTLTEAAIVLGIVGLILGAIWVAAAAVYANIRVNSANQGIISIVQGLRSLYSTQSTSTGLTLATAIDAGVVPRDMLNAAGDDIVNQWGGGGDIAATTDNLGISMTLTGIPEDACIKLVSTVAGTGRDAGLFQAAASATGPTLPAAIGAPIGIVAPTRAATGCANGANSIVRFSFRLKN